MGVNTTVITITEQKGQQELIEDTVSKVAKLIDEGFEFGEMVTGGISIKWESKND